MDKTTTVQLPFGEFIIKNELTIGEKTRIAVQRATLSNGMYGQMMQSPNPGEMNSAWNLFRICELDGRIEKVTPSEGWLGCDNLSAEDFDKLWKEWTEKSGLFLRPEKEPADAAPDDSEKGEGKR